jgi:hypothetical protein
MVCYVREAGGANEGEEEMGGEYTEEDFKPYGEVAQAVHHSSQTPSLQKKPPFSPVSDYFTAEPTRRVETTSTRIEDPSGTRPIVCARCGETIRIAHRDLHVRVLICLVVAVKLGRGNNSMSSPRKQQKSKTRDRPLFSPSDPIPLLPYFTFEAHYSNRHTSGVRLTRETKR